MSIVNNQLNIIDSFEKKNECEKVPLLQALKLYSEKDIVCFDVPGHVRHQGVEILNQYLGEDIMKMDINSSPIMDNVANPSGIIKEAQDLLAKAYKADDAFFITNGTTGAIQAMLLSVISPGDKILLPRNIHKSVINALIFCGGEPVFIQPDYDERFGISLNVNSETIKNTIEKNDNIKALFILNPTYYGHCSELDKIIKICHDKNILVLVDEAHGAHFNFHNDLPASASSIGADMSAVSIHKSGGALTQASALLVNRKNIDIKKVQQSINMLQSTSASYLLMASIDGARANLVQNGEVQLSKALNLSRYAKSKLKKIDGVKIINYENSNYKNIDETKLCINFKDLNITGHEVYEILYKKFDVQVELGDIYNILALVSIGTKKSDIDRLINAIKIISKCSNNNLRKSDIKIKQIIPTVKLTPREAFYSEKESVDIDFCVNRISGECIMAYPPGIPIISPGEIITKDIIDYIKILKNNNAYMTDMKDKDLNTIYVVCDKTK